MSSTEQDPLFLTCGPNSLLRICELLKIDTDFNELAQLSRFNPDEGTILLELRDAPKYKGLYFALGIIELSFPVIIVSNRTYVVPAGRESEFPRTRVATWRSLLQKTQFLTVRSINPKGIQGGLKWLKKDKLPMPAIAYVKGNHFLVFEETVSDGVLVTDPADKNNYHSSSA